MNKYQVCDLCRSSHWGSWNPNLIRCELGKIEFQLRSNGLMPIISSVLGNRYRPRLVRANVQYKIAPYWKRTALWVPIWVGAIIRLGLDRTSLHKFLTCKNEREKLLDCIMRYKGQFLFKRTIIANTV